MRGGISANDRGHLRLKLALGYAGNEIGVASVHMAYKMTASLRALATNAHLWPFERVLGAVTALGINYDRGGFKKGARRFQLLPSCALWLCADVSMA